MREILTLGKSIIFKIIFIYVPLGDPIKVDGNPLQAIKGPCYGEIAFLVVKQLSQLVICQSFLSLHYLQCVKIFGFSKVSYYLITQRSTYKINKVDYYCPTPIDRQAHDTAMICTKRSLSNRIKRLDLPLGGRHFQRQSRSSYCFTRRLIRVLGYY